MRITAPLRSDFLTVRLYLAAIVAIVWASALDDGVDRLRPGRQIIGEILR